MTLLKMGFLLHIKFELEALFLICFSAVTKIRLFACMTKVLKLDLKRRWVYLVAILQIIIPKLKKPATTVLRATKANNFFMTQNPELSCYFVFNH